MERSGSQGASEPGKRTAAPARSQSPFPANVEKTYRERTPASLREFRRVEPLIPGGVPSGLGVTAPHQTFIERGEGCYVWDVDGNRLLDMMQGDWLLPLGHCNPKVTAAITAQLAKGTTFAAAAPGLGYELASLIRKRMPSVERMRCATSGTEANQNAMRLARVFTGRKRIGKMAGAYHGTYDPLLISNGLITEPGYVPPGLIPGTVEDVVLLPFNDPEGCERIIEREKSDLAAVIFEPLMGVCGFLPATHELVRRLRAVTERHGVLLICDEVVTFPLTIGGAQGYYDVKPDLTTFGKAIGGGLPLAAYGGRADVMGLLDPMLHRGNPPVSIAATMGGMPVCLAAGIAAIEQLTPEAHRHLQALGDYTRSGIEALARKHDVPLQATGYGHFVGLQWTPTKVVDYETYCTSDRQVVSNLVLSLLNEGFLLFFIGPVLSLPMSTADIDRFLAALERALRENGLISR